MKGFSAFRKSAASSAQAAAAHVASTVNHVGAVVSGNIPGLRVYKVSNNNESSSSNNNT